MRLRSEYLHHGRRSRAKRENSTQFKYRHILAWTNLGPSHFRGAFPTSCSGSPTAGRRVDRHEFVVAADQEVTGVKVSMKQHGALLWAVVARDGIGTGDGFLQ